MKSILTGSLLLSALLATGCTQTHTNSAANNLIPGASDTVEPKPDAPLTANTRFAAGQVAEARGDWPEAIKQYEASCKLDPTAPLPLLHLALIYSEKGDFDRAIPAWHRYIKATNDDAAGYVNLGYTLELARRLPEAEAAYKTAITKQPTNETARVNYGLMLTRAGRLSEAVAQLQTVLTPAEVHYDLASVFESEGKKPAAKAEYQKALDLDPDMSDAKVRIAALE
jgi:tetratricopeptide (TPR) repeat protein